VVVLARWRWSELDGEVNVLATATRGGHFVAGMVRATPAHSVLRFCRAAGSSRVHELDPADPIRMDADHEQPRQPEPEHQQRHEGERAQGAVTAMAEHDGTYRSAGAR